VNYLDEDGPKFLQCTVIEAVNMVSILYVVLCKQCSVHPVMQARNVDNAVIATAVFVSLFFSTIKFMARILHHILMAPFAIL